MYPDILVDMANMTTAEISEKYKVSKCKVYNWRTKIVREIGIDKEKLYPLARFSGHNSKYTIIPKEDLLSDISNKELAKKYGVSSWTISQHRNEIGYIRQTPYDKMITKYPDIENDFKNMRQDKIAKKYNITKGTVSYYKKIIADNLGIKASDIVPKKPKGFNKDFMTLSYKELSKKYDVSYGVISKWADSSNIYDHATNIIRAYGKIKLGV